MRVLVFIAALATGIASGASTPRVGNGEVVVAGADTPATPQNEVSGNDSATRTVSRITGTVTDPDGKPAPQVRLSLFPSFFPSEKQTDSEGRFTLTFKAAQFGPAGAAQPILIARDPARNLAAAVDVEEDATNVNVRLERGLTLTGRITDPFGTPVTNAQAQALLRTERMASNLGRPVRVDGEGRYEIKGLPPGHPYSVHASARGFSHDQREVQASDTTTNHVELAVFQLLPANQRIEGVVLDDNSKPVARAFVYSNGNGQPNLNVQTDAKGQFSMNKVSAGPILLSANSQHGGYGRVTAEGGDTNVTIRISALRNPRMASSGTASLKGRALPDLVPLGLTSADAPAGQMLLAVLIDTEERPSRRALRVLGEKAAALKEQGVAVMAVQTGTMADDAFKTWKQDAALPFPVGRLQGEPEKFRAAWGAGALPWLILTDKAHRVTAEGFGLEELDAKLKAPGD